VFERTYRTAPTVDITRDEQGIPVDESDHWLGIEPDHDDGTALGPGESARDAELVTAS